MDKYVNVYIIYLCMYVVWYGAILCKNKIKGNNIFKQMKEQFYNLLFFTYMCFLIHTVQTVVCFARTHKQEAYKWMILDKLILAYISSDRNM